MVMYTLLYLKWITNKDLLYSTGNSVQCYVAAETGQKFRGEWVHVHVWLSPFIVHLKSSQHRQSAILQYKIKSFKEIIKKKKKTGGLSPTVRDHQGSRIQVPSKKGCGFTNVLVLIRKSYQTYTTNPVRQSPTKFKSCMLWKQSPN